MTKQIYGIFSECPIIGCDPDHMEEYVSLIKTSVDEGSQVVLADKHFVACPNFRRALRTPKYEKQLRDYINNGKIVVAMFDGMWVDGDEGGNGIKHFTFNEFQPWYNRYNLWWGPIESQYKDINETTKEELDFFDSDKLQKIHAASRNRDADFVDTLLRDINNPALKECFGNYHEKLVEIANSVYENGAAKGGIIFVEKYPPADNRNIYARVEQFLNGTEVSEKEKARMLGAIGAWGRATLCRIEAPMIEGATPVFSAHQKLWEAVFYNNSPNYPSIKPSKQVPAASKS